MRALQHAQGGLSPQGVALGFLMTVFVSLSAEGAALQDTNLKLRKQPCLPRQLSWVYGSVWKVKTLTAAFSLFAPYCCLRSRLVCRICPIMSARTILGQVDPRWTPYIGHAEDFTLADGDAAADGRRRANLRTSHAAEAALCAYGQAAAVKKDS